MARENISAGSALISAMASNSQAARAQRMQGAQLLGSSLNDFANSISAMQKNYNDRQEQIFKQDQAKSQLELQRQNQALAKEQFKLQKEDTLATRAARIKAMNAGAALNFANAGNINYGVAKDKEDRDYFKKNLLIPNPQEQTNQSANTQPFKPPYFAANSFYFNRF